MVVSNLGPHATVALAGRESFEHSYLARLDRDVRPTAILWLHFASDEPVLDYSAIAVCGTRRVNMVDAPSYDCPDVAPPGRHLYTVGAAPLDTLARGDFGAAGTGRPAQGAPGSGATALKSRPLPRAETIVRLNLV